MGGPIHYITSDKTGTKVALSYGSDIAIVEQHTICELDFTPTRHDPIELITTAVWTNTRNLPEPPPLPGLDEELPAPAACSLHFIENGRSLVVSYVDHRIM